MESQFREKNMRASFDGISGVAILLDTWTWIKELQKFSIFTVEFLSIFSLKLSARSNNHNHVPR